MAGININAHNSDMYMKSISNRILTSVFALVFLFGPGLALGWGPEGHRVVGAIAADYLDQSAVDELQALFGTDDLDSILEWCNWPDAYRGTEEGEWTYPLHFINMVPGESMYDRERDCPDGLCVTEAIGKFAAELGNRELPMEKRQQAYGFVCHFVGDLHQPLHAGFGHDRGGNDFLIQYKGEEMNLHGLWDSVLILERSDSWQSLYDKLSDRSGANPSPDWQATEVINWTNESHAFAETKSYPEQTEITKRFANRSWCRIQSQLRKGGKRLAWVLNTILAENPEPNTGAGH